MNSWFPYFLSGKCDFFKISANQKASLQAIKNGATFSRFQVSSKQDASFVMLRLVYFYHSFSSNNCWICTNLHDNQITAIAIFQLILIKGGILFYSLVKNIALIRFVLRNAGNLTNSSRISVKEPARSGIWI